MMTLRLEKTDPARTEFYECDTAVIYHQKDCHTEPVEIATYSNGGVTSHFVGEKPGQAVEAFLMNESGKTVDILRVE